MSSQKPTTNEPAPAGSPRAVEATADAVSAESGAKPKNGSPAAGIDPATSLGFLRDVPLEISVEIGRKRMVIGDVLALGPSAIIELDKAAGEALDIRVNGVLVARGEAVVVNDRFGVRLTSLVESSHLLHSLQPGR